MRDIGSKVLSSVIAAAIIGTGVFMFDVSQRLTRIETRLGIHTAGVK